MSNHYCPFCGSKATYEAVKPTNCPKCKKPFEAAFKGAVAAPTPVQPDPDDDLPLPPTRSAVVAKPRYRHGEVVPPVPTRTTEATVVPLRGPDEEADDEDEYVDPRARRRLARELAASIDPSTIHIDDEDEGTVTFGQLYNNPDATAARNMGN